MRASRKAKLWHLGISNPHNGPITQSPLIGPIFGGQNRGPIKQAPVYCHNHRVGDPSHECCCPPCYKQSESSPTIMADMAPSFEFAANVKQLTSLLEHFLFRSFSQSVTLLKGWTQEITRTLVPSTYYSPEMFLISWRKYTSPWTTTHT